MRQNSTSEMVSDSGDEGGLSTSSAKSKRSSTGTPKRSGWLRNSFSKAFNKEGKGKKNSIKGGSVSDAEESLQNSPKHQPYQGMRAASALSGHISNLPPSPIKSRYVYSYYTMYERPHFLDPERLCVRDL